MAGERFFEYEVTDADGQTEVRRSSDLRELARS